MLVQGSHSIAMFAAPSYVNLIATYISGVHIIRAYNIDDLFHTGYMVNIVYIVCTCMHNNTDSQLYSFMVKNCTYIGAFFPTIFFLLS